MFSFPLLIGYHPLQHDICLVSIHPTAGGWGGAHKRTGRWNEVNWLGVWLWYGTHFPYLIFVTSIISAKSQNSNGQIEHANSERYELASIWLLYGNHFLQSLVT